MRQSAGILLCWALAGCASTSDVSTRYQPTGTETLERLMLVGRTPEKPLRHRWEDECARALEGKAEMVRSHTLLPLWYEPGTERLEDAARQRDIDAILVAELTRLLLPRPHLPQPDLLNDQRGALEDPIGEPQWSFFIGRKEKKDAPNPTYYEVDFQLLAADGTLIWAGSTITHEANELGAIAHSQCRALKKTFNELGLWPDKN
jgi:hypothetical protein